jgi:PPK2 family polyphosphate:nucleotide phosphotransferase
MKRTPLALILALASLPLSAQVREIAPLTGSVQPVRAPIAAPGAAPALGVLIPDLQSPSLAVPELAAPAAPGVVLAASAAPGVVLAAEAAVPEAASFAPEVSPISFQAAPAAPSDNSPSAKVSRFVQRFVAPFAKGDSIDLSKVDSSDISEVEGYKNPEKKAMKKFLSDKEKLKDLQAKLYADGKKSVLIVLQGMDTSGKDGTIKHVLGGINPQGVEVTGFKKPTAEEASHHYLWRLEKALVDKGVVTKEMLGNGRIGVFNRSQYEDILVPTVFKTHSPEEIEKRYDEINQWEKKLTESGVTIIKLFLHISKDEQKDRLQRRLDIKKKNWKFSKFDLEMRKKWEEFQGVYGSILARTSTEWAPWHIIPADNKWYRNFVVGRILKKAMKKMDLKFPPPQDGLGDIVIPD